MRFDAATALRLLADNAESHAALLAEPVIQAIVQAAGVAGVPRHAPTQAKALGALRAMAQCGTDATRAALARAGARDAAECALESEDPGVRRAGAGVRAELAGPRALGEDPCSEFPEFAEESVGGRRSLRTPAPLGEGSGDSRVSRVSQSGGRGSSIRGDESLARLNAAMEEGDRAHAAEFLLDAVRAGNGRGLLEKAGLNWISKVASGGGGGVAAGVFAALCKGDTATRSLFVRQGGVALAAALVRSSDVTTQGGACSALATLSNHTHLQPHMVSEGVLPVLLKAATRCEAFFRTLPSPPTAPVSVLRLCAADRRSCLCSPEETVRVPAAKALSHLSSNSAVRQDIVNYGPLKNAFATLKIKSGTDDPYLAYMSLISRP